MTNRVTFVYGVLFALATAVLLAGEPQQATAPTKRTAAQALKNIQVLKEIPEDQLIPTMQFISASLGVECDFCHVEREMDKDDKKPKKTAREMMRMTMAINHDNFQGGREVTCNSCHRGSSRPQAIPAIMTEAPKPGVASDQLVDRAEIATWPSASSILLKFVEAAGGEAAVKQVATRIEKGNAVMTGGRQVPIEIFAKSPDQRVSIMHVANGESVTAYNGHEGWLSAPGRPLREMSESDQDAARLDAMVFFPSHLAALFETTKLQPHAEDVGGQAATVVWGLAKAAPPVKLYFDPQSGLLVRMLHYTDTALGLNPTQLDFFDYREVGSTKTPYRWRIARPSGAFTVQLDSVQDNVPIDGAKFQKPAPSETTEAGTTPH
jgi:hypothetical protein